METSFTEQQIVVKEPVTNSTNRNSIDEIISFVVHQETNELEQENSKEDDLLMEFINKFTLASLVWRPSSIIMSNVSCLLANVFVKKIGLYASLEVCK
jgi:hypothetical protein